MAEEVSINLPLESFQPLTVYEGIDVEIGGPIRAEFFVARNISLTQIRVTEGCLVVADAGDIFAIGRAPDGLCSTCVESFRDRHLMKLGSSSRHQETLQ